MGKTRGGESYVDGVRIKHEAAKGEHTYTNVERLNRISKKIKTSVIQFQTNLQSAQAAANRP